VYAALLARSAGAGLMVLATDLPEVGRAPVGARRAV
jgi:hypothetical protein